MYQKILPQVYPLSPSWEIENHEETELELGQLHMHGVGFVATHKETGDKAFGAGASEDRDAASRCSYFELLERTVLLEPDTKDRILSSFGLKSSDRYRPSVSNGTAVQQVIREAQKSSLLELFERHSVLSSWLGMSGVTRVQASCPDLVGYYDVAGYVFGEATLDGDPAFSAGFFLFPKWRSHYTPFVYGYGAALGFDAAMEKAKRECLQRLTFLSDRDAVLPELEGLVLTPTADFHQDWSLTTGGQESIRRWLLDSEGEDVLLMPELFGPQGQFEELTPLHLASKLAVVRAQHSQLIPLVFGDQWLEPMRQAYGDLELPKKAPERGLIHPIA